METAKKKQQKSNFGSNWSRYFGGGNGTGVCKVQCKACGRQ